MRKHWWKILSVLILLYTFIGGMIIPLRPGIQSVETSGAACGEKMSVDILGYNTNWDKNAETNQVWLKQGDSLFLEATSLETQAFNKMRAQFSIPANYPNLTDEVAVFSLLINGLADGPMILPQQLFVDLNKCGKGIVGWDSKRPKGLIFNKTLSFPYRNILKETIRNTYYHVPMWMAMFALLFVAVFFSAQFLRTNNEKYDYLTHSLILIATLYGTMGLCTGMVWAEYTWGKFWSWDIKQTMALLAMLMYVAYLVIRMSITDITAKRKFSAVYSIMAFILLFPLVYIVPRLGPSLHPGSGGNPAMGGEDMDHTMRLFFYPAIIGWTLFGLWLAQLYRRMSQLKDKMITEYWLKNEH